MQKINIYENYFSELEKEICSFGELSATLFTYKTGVKAIKIKNSKGSATILPYMGQMIWRLDFNGVELSMKTMYTDPIPVTEDYTGSYGCFLMHCGLTAMGNPTERDNHKPHGELPIAKYEDVCILMDTDEKGDYIAVTGKYNRKFCYDVNYDFIPLIKLYKNATFIDIKASFTNNKDIPLEYYYLCHINHKPIDGAKLLYTADRKTIKVNRCVPENYWDEAGGDATNKYLDRLMGNPSLMDEVGQEGQAYSPEIVFSMKYTADENGNAYTMQLNPDGTATYVVHRPEELPVGTRWISRTEDEDAMGMILPATSEHLGRTYCREHGQQKYLNKGETITYNMQTGLLDEKGAKALAEKIKSMGF